MKFAILEWVARERAKPEFPDYDGGVLVRCGESEVGLENPSRGEFEHAMNAVGYDEEWRKKCESLKIPLG